MFDFKKTVLIVCITYVKLYMQQLTQTIWDMTENKLKLKSQPSFICSAWSRKITGTAKPVFEEKYQNINHR